MPNWNTGSGNSGSGGGGSNLPSTDKFVKDNFEIDDKGRLRFKKNVYANTFFGESLKVAANTVYIGQNMSISDGGATILFKDQFNSQVYSPLLVKDSGTGKNIPLFIEQGELLIDQKIYEESNQVAITSPFTGQAKDNYRVYAYYFKFAEAKSNVRLHITNQDESITYWESDSEEYARTNGITTTVGGWQKIDLKTPVHFNKDSIVKFHIKYYDAASKSWYHIKLFGGSQSPVAYPSNSPYPSFKRDYLTYKFVQMNADYYARLIEKLTDLDKLRGDSIRLSNQFRVDANAKLEIDQINVEVEKFKNGDKVNLGLYRGTISTNEPMSTFTGEKGDYWTANKPMVLGGISFGAGDKIVLKTKITTTPSTFNDVNKFIYIPLILPTATSSSLGAIASSDGLQVDSFGSLSVKTGTGLEIESNTKKLKVKESEIDVSLLKNYALLSKGEYKGELPIALTDLANAKKGYFWRATTSKTLAGTNFNVGDDLYCVNDVVGTPADLTNFTRIASVTQVLQGATASSDGIGGIVPVPLKGEHSRVLYGDAKWKMPLCQFDKSFNYKAGDVVFYKGIMAKAITDIAANTDFTWGVSNGFMPYLTGGTFKGVYRTSESYTIGDIIVDTLAGGTQFYICTETHTSSNSSDAMTVELSIETGKWQPYDVANQRDILFYRMRGASKTLDGRGGLTPKPLKTDIEKYLKGDGTWSSIPEVTGATTIDGKSGLVPTPTIAQKDKPLLGSGSFGDIPYTDATTSKKYKLVIDNGVPYLEEIL